MLFDVKELDPVQLCHNPDRRQAGILILNYQTYRGIKTAAITQADGRNRR